MKNDKIKVIEFLKMLDNWEMNQFSEFVNSPFFNKHVETKTAFGFIAQQIKKRKAIDKKSLFQQLYPEQTYDVQKISNILSYIMKLLEQFISFKQQQQTDKSSSQLNLLRFLSERSSNHYFEQEFRNIKKHQENALNSFYAYQLYDEHELNRKKRNQSESIELSNNFLDVFYFKEKFRLGCNMQSRKNVVANQFDFSLFDILEKFIQTHPEIIRSNNNLHVYYLSYKLIVTENEVFYFELKDFLQKKELKISKENKKEIYNYLQNYIIKRINNGARKFLEELYVLYLRTLENGIIFNNGFLSQWEYKNIVTTGCRLGKFEWTKNFIVAYKNRLEPSIADNAYQFNLASFYNYLKQHDKTLEVLRDVQFNDVYYYLNTNVLLIRSYFGLAEHELLLQLLDTFRIYLLRNKKMSTYQKKLYKNLIMYSKKLSLLEQHKNNYSKPEYEERKIKIHEQIKNKKDTIALDWLLEISS